MNKEVKNCVDGNWIQTNDTSSYLEERENWASWESSVDDDDVESWSNFRYYQFYWLSLNWNFSSLSIDFIFGFTMLNFLHLSELILL